MDQRASPTFSRPFIQFHRAYAFLSLKTQAQVVTSLRLKNNFFFFQFLFFFVELALFKQLS